MDTPLISIVLPCYNHGEYVETAIQSVLNQTYSNFELFIFDNGSSDDSWDKINLFNDKRIKKIRLIKNDMLEVKKQFIAESVGEYCAIMCSDDVWLPEKLEKQMKFFAENQQTRVCFTWALAVDENLKEIPECRYAFVTHNKSIREWRKMFEKGGNCLSYPSFVAERDIYVKYFGKLYPYRQLADYYCWLKILCETNLYVVEEYLVKQRLHQQGENKNESAATLENAKRVELDYRHIYYKIISEMPDDVFVRDVVEPKDVPQCYSHMDVLGWKMMHLLELGRKRKFFFDNAVLFYQNYFDYEENGEVFYQYLERRYDFGRKSFFDYEGEDNALVDSVKVFQSTKESRQALGRDFDLVKYPPRLAIYGKGKIGKAFAEKIRNKCEIQCFIDRMPDKEPFYGISVVDIEHTDFSKIKVIVVTVSYDFEKIESELRKYCTAETKIVRLEEFCKN